MWCCFCEGFCPAWADTDKQNVGSAPNHINSALQKTAQQDMDSTSVRVCST